MVVNILGVPYSIREVPCITKEAIRLGQVDHTRQEILLDAGLAEQRKQVVLWHEIFHCIFYALGYDDEEQTVQSLASSINQILKDNPKLITFS
ncbi:MAG: hypothetical protein ABFC57_12845 [Veillonellales bacterium]